MAQVAPMLSQKILVAAVVAFYMTAALVMVFVNKAVLVRSSPSVSTLDNILTWILAVDPGSPSPLSFHPTFSRSGSSPRISDVLLPHRNSQDWDGHTEACPPSHLNQCTRSNLQHIVSALR